METSNSDAKNVVLHAQSDRSCLGLIETCYSVTEAAVLHVKTTGEGWNRYSLVMLVQITLFFMHKTTGEDWDP